MKAFVKLVSFGLCMTLAILIGRQLGGAVNQVQENSLREMRARAEHTPPVEWKVAVRADGREAESREIEAVNSQEQANAQEQVKERAQREQDRIDREVQPSLERAYAIVAARQQYIRALKEKQAECQQMIEDSKARQRELKIEREALLRQMQDRNY
jgi:hypothetical protein